jgi:hypothetical protein
MGVKALILWRQTLFSVWTNKKPRHLGLGCVRGLFWIRAF